MYLLRKCTSLCEDKYSIKKYEEGSRAKGG